MSDSWKGLIKRTLEMQILHFIYALIAQKVFESGRHCSKQQTNFHFV